MLYVVPWTSVKFDVSRQDQTEGRLLSLESNGKNSETIKPLNYTPPLQPNTVSNQTFSAL